MGRGAWQATAHEVARESDPTEQLNNNKCLDSHALSDSGELACLRDVKEATELSPAGKTILSFH